MELKAGYFQDESHTPKISELIRFLESTLKAHGDIPAYININYGGTDFFFVLGYGTTDSSDHPENKLDKKAVMFNLSQEIEGIIAFRKAPP